MREPSNQLVWSEEEMRYLEPPPRPARPGLSNPLRTVLARQPMLPTHEQTKSSIVYAPAGRHHGNFIDASYQRIKADPAWAKRLTKAHTAKRQARPTGPKEETRAWRELDAATSSDALLMNIFCYPRVLASLELPTLLGVEAGLEPEFGYRPKIALANGLKDRTEIDMRLGPLLVEAKLTETDFQTAPLRLLERYRGCYELLDRESLEIINGKVAQYQLLRGILVAQALDADFCLLLDARRTDLIERWASTLSAVRSFELRTRLKLLTWQEIAPVLPHPLRNFLALKYEIHAYA